MEADAKFMSMNRLYEELLIISERYLSKDAHKFLDRQINTHLRKQPRDIVPEDRAELAKWCMVSAALLVGKAKAQHLANEILDVAPEA